MMKIHLVVNNTSFPWSPQSYDKGEVNGSEEMVVLFSRALVKAGHEVVVYSSWTGEDEGVIYKEKSRFFSQVDLSGILVCFKEPLALTHSGNFSKRFLWTADPNQLTPAQRRQCDVLVALSPYHERELRSINIGYHTICHISPGFDPVPRTPGVERIHRQCLYASSPDRGLDFLIKAWPTIREATGATLLVTYSNSITIETAGVNYIGRVSNFAMDELYQSSDVLLYPCTGGERFCLTALKAQYYGTIPCVIPTMALQDTVQFGKKSLRNHYIQDSISLLDDDSWRQDHRGSMQHGLIYSTWPQTVEHWESLFGHSSDSSRERKRHINKEDGRG